MGLLAAKQYKAEVSPRVFVIVGSNYLLIKGLVQNIDDVVTVKALFVESLEAEEHGVPSHDFH